MSKSLSRFLKKSNHDQIALVTLLKRDCDSSESLSKSERFAQKSLYFLYVFDSLSLFFPFLWPGSNRSRRSSLRHFLIRSGRSLQKSNCEQSAHVAQYKRATVSHFVKSDGSDSLFSISYFALLFTKNERFAGENQRAHSQPIIITVLQTTVEVNHMHAIMYEKKIFYSELVCLTILLKSLCE